MLDKHLVYDICAEQYTEHIRNGQIALSDRRFIAQYLITTVESNSTPSGLVHAFQSLASIHLLFKILLLKLRSHFGNREEEAIIHKLKQYIHEL